jgi:hypothetical protein
MKCEICCDVTKGPCKLFSGFGGWGWPQMRRRRRSIIDDGVR